MRRAVLFGAMSTVVLAACSETPTAPSPGRPAASVGGASGNYIVRFGDQIDSDKLARELAKQYGIKLKHVYKSAIKGFAGELPDEVAELLEDRTDVLIVERDQLAYAITTQTNPPSWGLDRIDQRNLPLSATYTYETTGAGVKVFIIDTGINFTHVDFGGRAVTGEDEITPGGTAADCNGHGSHVAGTVGGSSFGVAKGVTLVAVRVLNCFGSGAYSQVIAGVDYVTGQKNLNPSVPMAANMSLGGGLSSALNAAVANSIAAGVTYALAAGNESTDACTRSPASTPEAITVAATTITDARASYSNFGPCVDIFAPGSGITSAWYTSNTATNTISGTSMASPHVAGAVALYLETNPAASPATVASALSANATPDVVTNPGGFTTNKLLFVGSGSPPPPPPPPTPPPVASFTYSCTNFNCSFNGSSSTGATTYSWNFGDNTTGNGVTVSHTFARRRTYSVTLTVGNGTGQTNSTSKIVTCNNKRCS